MLHAVKNDSFARHVISHLRYFLRGATPPKKKNPGSTPAVEHFFTFGFRRAR